MLISLTKWLQFLTEKNFKQTIPQVKVEDGEEITYEKATAALRRAIHFFSALQASDGHWPAQLTGVLFFLPPLVRLIIIINLFFFFFLLSMSSLWSSHNQTDTVFGIFT
jgi:hypothetical protein